MRVGVEMKENKHGANVDTVLVTRTISSIGEANAYVSHIFSYVSLPPTVHVDGHALGSFLRTEFLEVAITRDIPIVFRFY